MRLNPYRVRKAAQTNSFMPLVSAFAGHARGQEIAALILTFEHRSTRPSASRENVVPYAVVIKSLAGRAPPRGVTIFADRPEQPGASTPQTSAAISHPPSAKKLGTGGRLRLRPEEVLKCAETEMILVVDNDAAIRRQLTTLLERTHAKVEAVDDGHDALARLESRRYSVVILDLMMPRTDADDPEALAAILLELADNDRAPCIVHGKPFRLTDVRNASKTFPCHEKGLTVLRESARPLIRHLPYGRFHESERWFCTSPRGACS